MVHDMIELDDTARDGRGWNDVVVYDVRIVRRGGAIEQIVEIRSSGARCLRDWCVPDGPVGPRYGVVHRDPSAAGVPHPLKLTEILLSARHVAGECLLSLGPAHFMEARAFLGKAVAGFREKICT